MEGGRHFKKPNLRSRPWIVPLWVLCSIAVGIVWMVLCSRILISNLRMHQSEQTAHELQAAQEFSEALTGRTLISHQSSHEKISSQSSLRMTAASSDLVTFGGPNDRNSSWSQRKDSPLSPLRLPTKQGSSLSRLPDMDTSMNLAKLHDNETHVSPIKRIEIEYKRDGGSISGPKSLARITVTQPYHSPTIFEEEYIEMVRNMKIFVYPHSRNDPFSEIFLPVDFEPTGNYASESYFKKALMSSRFVTKNASEAALFYLPFSIARLRHDRRVGVKGLKDFVRNYVATIRDKWPYWNRTGGADHFYVSCHSISRTVAEKAVHLQLNSIQVVCSSNSFLWGYVPHKDVSLPQVWPRRGTPPEAKFTKQRKILAFFAGAANSDVRAKVVKTWLNDSEIVVHSKRISTPYSRALLTSKFCLHAKGFEVNTARLADAMHYGCVPVIIANNYDLPFNNVLDWKQLSIVVPTLEIPHLKRILKEVTPENYERLQKNVMQVRRHFQWHSPPKDYDAFYMVMYELWLRRHVLRVSV